MLNQKSVKEVMMFQNDLQATSKSFVFYSSQNGKLLFIVKTAIAPIA